VQKPTVNKNLAKNINAHKVTQMSKGGRPKGSGEMTDQITVRISPELKAELDEAAALDRRSRSNYIIHVLEKHLQIAEDKIPYGTKKGARRPSKSDPLPKPGKSA